MSLNSKWVQGTLTKDDIKEWAKEQALAKGLDEEELDHVVTCLHHIYLWYKENYPIGSFLTYVVKNDFIGASCAADKTNVKVLPVYARFLWNCAPGDWREKGKRYLEANR